jgi:hypothetical protein
MGRPFDQGHDLVDVDIDKVVRVLDRAIVIEKDGEEFVVGKSPIDNIDDVLEAFEAKEAVSTLVVPKWLARENEWPEGEG